MLNWGVAGCARIVSEKFLEAFLIADNARLIAIASRRPGAAASMKKEADAIRAAAKPERRHDIRFTYDSIEELLANPEVQAVYLPMAQNEHVEWALKAVEAKKHVLIEKPMTLNVADIDTITTAARNQQVQIIITEGFMYRYHPQHARVKEFAKLIGPVRSARASFGFPITSKRMYRVASSMETGGGCLYDVGPYAVSTLRLAFECEPLSVFAMAKFADTGADMSMSGVLDFGQGRFGTFDISFERSRVCEYEIMGATGGAKCHQVWTLPTDAPVLSYWTDNGKREEERLPVGINHFQLEIEGVSRAILTGATSAPVTLADSRANCAVLQALALSAQQQRMVRLSEIN
jgi:xylose dehydrogenase (NAD/NADP)